MHLPIPFLLSSHSPAEQSSACLQNFYLIVGHCRRQSAGFLAHLGILIKLMYYEGYNVGQLSLLRRSVLSHSDNKQVSGYSLRLRPNPRFARTSDTCPLLCAQPSLQMLAGESPVMVKPESHVVYTQC